MSSPDMNPLPSTSRFADAKKRLAEVQQEWTIDVMLGCAIVCHPIGPSSCSPCDAYAEHIAAAALKSAIILDQKLVKEKVFEAFPALAKDFHHLQDDVDDYRRDCESLMKDLDAAKSVEDKLRDRIDDLEKQLKKAARAAPTPNTKK